MVQYFHIIELWYNSIIRSAIDMTLFETLYGLHPLVLDNYIKGCTSIPSFDSTLQHKHAILNTLKKILIRNRKKMKNKANKRRRDCTFFERDFILLHLYPYQKIFVQRRASEKTRKMILWPIRSVTSCKISSIQV